MSNKLTSYPDFELTIRLKGSAATEFFGSSPVVLENAVREYANKLINESRSEERRQIRATKTVEITAQIVESAKWELISAMRRTAKYSSMLLFLHILMGILTIPLGIGASNFNENWGIILSLICGVCYVLIFITHVVLSRD